MTLNLLGATPQQSRQLYCTLQSTGEFNEFVQNHRLSDVLDLIEQATGYSPELALQQLRFNQYLVGGFDHV